MTRDYKAALEQIGSEIDIARNAGFPMYDDPYVKTIIQALRIADRLMGDPSEGMVLKGRGEMNHFDNSSIAIYKAMRDQMLKEIEQEQHH